MCGIVGFNWNDKQLLKKMSDTIIHRGPDQFGYFEDKGISLGHRRLSIIDLSEKAKQPMFNEDNSIVLVYNGEIYNFKELRKELQKKGHKFNSETDSEVVLHAYEEYGENCVLKFNGMFAFAIWDSKNQKLFLARDRSGIKPLYYWYKDGKMIFASEIKSILEDKEVKRIINSNSLGQFLERKTVFGNETFFKDIKKLLPGQTLILQKKEIILKNFYSLNFTNNEDNLNFNKEFDNVIKDMLVSDVPLGVFLSGGLDSSLVTAFMAKHTKNLNTFTVGFDLSTDEFKFAKKVAEKFSTNHHELNISFKDMTNVLDKIVWHMDEPIADPAIIPTFIMSKFAKKKVSVCLIGEGSDELFAGYSKYKLSKLLPKQVYFAISDVVFNNREKKKLLKKDYYQPTSKSFIKPYFKIKNKICAAMAFDFKEVMPNYQLMKIDKMTMANSLEARVPFLDNRIISIGEKMKNECKFKKDQGKYFLRELSKKMLPPSFAKDKKRSFYTPLKDWFNNEIIERACSDLESSELFNKKAINKLTHLNKTSIRRYKYSNQLWTLYLIEKWYRK
ncbi:MAG: asparagine synthase (glutamine-hydrolyzing), partial [Nanoarchaeota archaeon]|nr:asparagine synthase (glutamine-hydrolyzing) [Nanoarchaeota archaeon]